MRLRLKQIHYAFILTLCMELCAGGADNKNKLKSRINRVSFKTRMQMQVSLLPPEGDILHYNIRTLANFFFFCLWFGLFLHNYDKQSPVLKKKRPPYIRNITQTLMVKRIQI